MITTTEQTGAERAVTATYAVTITTDTGRIVQPDQLAAALLLLPGVTDVQTQLTGRDN